MGSGEDEGEGRRGEEDDAVKGKETREKWREGEEKGKGKKRDEGEKMRGKRNKGEWLGERRGG